MVASKYFLWYADLYLSGDHKRSNLCHSLQSDSIWHSGSPQREEQNHGGRSDTGPTSGRYNACMSCHMAYRFPTEVKFHKFY